MSEAADHSWTEVLLFCLAAGGAWGFFKEWTILGRLRAQEKPSRFNWPRAVGRSLLAWAAILAGLAFLSLLGLADLPKF